MSIKIDKRGRKYIYNFNYFDIINSEDKAYYLGLLYADGCNLGSRIRLVLQEDDKEILVKFSAATENTQPLRESENAIKTRKRLCIYEMSGKDICQKLSNLGCTPRKSLVLNFPNENQVPKHLIRHFIRGYFDGDGTVSLTYNTNGLQLNVALLSTNNFCQSLSLLLKELDINHNIYKTQPDNGVTRSLAITNDQDKIRFLDWLYGKSNFYLKRKYDNYFKAKSAFLSGHLSKPKKKKSKCANWNKP